MKIKVRQPKFNEILHVALINKGWKPLQEPKNLASAIFLSIPFMFINLMIAIGIIKIFSFVSLGEFGLSSSSFTFTINLHVFISLIVLVALHELFHLILIPDFIGSPNTYIGLTLYGGFVVTEEEIAKKRFILITCAPFLIISILAPLLIGSVGWMTPLAKQLSLLNALASSVDMVYLFLVINQVPTNAVIKNNGPKTYWRNVGGD